ncbi:MAG: Crp/Fnr family transcriptional regulator [Brevundimonas sp.]
MSSEDRDALLAVATPYEFSLGHVFSEAGDLVTHLYFVDSGIISAVAVMQDGRTVESYMVGAEGVTSPVAAAAVTCSFSRLTAQAPGSAYRVEATRLRALMQQRPGLHLVVADYAAAGRNELEQSVACNALHRSDRRFAKWLLRCHDRLAGDTLHLTQEYLAAMLGSQRTTVNEAAQTLQKGGSITYSRGRVTVTDRAALERVACECYRAIPVARLPDNLVEA